MPLSDRERHMEDYPDEFEDGYDFDEMDDEEDFDCGIMYDGRTHKLIGCGKAGSEECDFECPYRAEMYRSLAAQQGHITRKKNAKAKEIRP